VSTGTTVGNDVCPSGRAVGKGKAEGGGGWQRKEGGVAVTVVLNGKKNAVVDD